MIALLTLAWADPLSLREVETSSARRSEESACGPRVGEGTVWVDRMEVAQIVAAGRIARIEPQVTAHLLTLDIPSTLKGPPGTQAVRVLGSPLHAEVGDTVLLTAAVKDERGSWHTYASHLLVFPADEDRARDGTGCVPAFVGQFFCDPAYAEPGFTLAEALTAASAELTPR